MQARTPNHYNAHDIEAFAACFADEIEAFELPSMSPILSGKAALIRFWFIREPAPGSP